MSMTIETIKHLEQTTLLANVNEKLSATKVKRNLLVVPHGFSVDNLESSMEFRDSYRANFKTKSISDFGKYCKIFDKEGAMCFVDSDYMVAKTMLDLGTEKQPLHQNHNAKLDLDKTAAFKALLSINGQHLEQKEASDFVDDWSVNMMIFSKEGVLMQSPQASRQLREITIDKISSNESIVGDFSASMSTSEKIAAKNQELIPAAIDFKCIPYHGLEERKFQIRISILAGGEKPKISFRIIKLEAIEEEMAEEFKEILVKEFKGTKIQSFIGEG